MPAASSMDYILAGIADIVHALQSPMANTPFAPLSDSHTKALHLLMDILHVHVTTDPVTTDALRVAAKNMELEPVTTDSLRVAAKNKEPNLHQLAIPSVPTPVPTPIVTPVQSPQQALPPTLPPPHTWARTEQATAPAPWRSPRNHPGSHWAAHVATTTELPPSTNVAPHWALHGNAFNPDTGELAEYTELSRSSEGTLWRAANTAEIHRLAQGTPNSPGTDTMHFIAIGQLPPGTKATYLHVVCAF